jgi:hypothetical protein
MFGIGDPHSLHQFLMGSHNIGKNFLKSKSNEKIPNAIAVCSSGERLPTVKVWGIMGEKES